jgi:hypothetical protein
MHAQEFNVIEDDIKLAAQTWHDWCDVFEHSGALSDNPLLANSEKFESFLKIYSVGRTIRGGKRHEFRLRLREPKFQLSSIVSDLTGATFDKKESELRRDFGTHTPARSVRSALSKIASFLAPHAFLPWDQFACSGLNRTLGRSHHSLIGSYSEYTSELNALIDGKVGQCVRTATISRYPTQYSARKDRFHRRVLDVALMRIGGRDWKKEHCSK